jgi:hypothetical protein
MATKKQQRRRYQRAKEHQRSSHDGEVDAEGGQKPERKPAPGRRGRGAQEVGPPSIVRAARRAALFAIVVFIMFQVLPFGKKLSPQAAAIEAAAFFLWLIPLQYLIDRWKYNRWLKSRG